MTPEADPSATSRRNRRLLPAVPATIRRQETATTSAASSASSPAAQLPRARHTPVKVACEACRKRKIKCDGTRPRCTPCSDRDASCFYESATPAETKTQALKRKYDEVRRENEDYEELYRLLQTLPERESHELFRRLRSGSDVITTLRQASDGDLLLQMAVVPETRLRYEFPYLAAMPETLLRPDNLYLTSMVYQTTFVASPQDLQGPELRNQDAYLTPYHAAVLIDANIDQVTTDMWTNVITDNNLLRLLLEAYFLYGYPYLPAIQKDIFLKAMVDGDERFCTPLLANIVLASACSYCMRVPRRYKVWDPRNLGYKFTAEARRLWDIAQDEPCLTTIQAALLFNMLYACHGLDRLGFVFLEYAVAQGSQLGLFQPEPNLGYTEEIAQGFTAWAIFNWQCVQGYYYLRSPLMRNPPSLALPDPEDDPSWYGEIWIRYPLQSAPIKLHYGTVFNAMSHLRIILNDISVQWVSQRPATLPQLAHKQALIIKTRLKSWFDALSAPLLPRAIVQPCHLKIHLEFYAALFNIARLQSIPSDSQTNPSEQGIRWSEMLIAIRCLETIIRLYYLRHGYEFADPFLPYFLQLLGYFIVENIQTKDEKQLKALHSTLILCTKGIYEQGAHIHISYVIYRLFRERLDPAVSEVIDQHLIIDEERDEEHAALSDHIRSDFPLATSAVPDEAKSWDLTSLAQEYDRMNLGDHFGKPG